MDSIKDLVTKLTQEQESNKRNEKCKKELEDVEKAEKHVRKKWKLLKSCLEWEIKYGKILESEIIILEKKEKLLNEEELLDKVKFAMDNNSNILIKYILDIEKWK